MGDTSWSTAPVQQPCSICGTCRRWTMCDDCLRSYDRSAHQDGSVMEAIRWAAKRARVATVRRERLRARMKRAGIL